MAHVKREESKLNEDAFKYRNMVYKAKKTIEWMRNNLGNP